MKNSDIVIEENECTMKFLIKQSMNTYSIIILRIDLLRVSVVVLLLINNKYYGFVWKQDTLH